MAEMNSFAGHHGRGTTDLVTDEFGTDLLIDATEIELGEKIGAGGFSIVYEGRWKGAEVAVKRFHHDMDERTKRQFLKETSLHVTLRHPCVVAFYGACFTPPEMHCVLELCGGGDLYRTLRSDRRLPGAKRLRWIMELSQGLAFLHNRSLLHRDLKSLNCFLTNNDQLKLGDFGLSQVFEDNGFSVQSTRAVGTPGWVAPEVLRANEYSIASDIYAFSVVVWELYSREVPYSGLTGFKLIREIEAGLRPEIPEQCPPMLASLLKDGWSDDVGVRPTINDVSDRLVDMSSVLEEHQWPREEA